jgi:hypothetical protein
LFCHFSTQNDIIERERLANLEVSTNGKVKVFICLQLAPPNWSGICGPITTKNIVQVGVQAKMPYFTEQEYLEPLVDPSVVIRERKTWYSCSGTPGFCSRTKESLRELNIPLDNTCVF